MGNIDLWHPKKVIFLANVGGVHIPVIGILLP
jgi:hypothetical protein